MTDQWHDKGREILNIDETELRVDSYVAGNWRTVQITHLPSGTKSLTFRTKSQALDDLKERLVATALRQAYEQGREDILTERYEEYRREIDKP